MAVTKFSEMKYTRPDVQQVTEAYRQLTARAEKAESGRELADIFKEHTRLDDEFGTAARLAQIRHTLDTRDEFYDAENDFFDQEAPGVGNAQLALYRALLASPHKQGLAEEYGDILLQKMEVAAASASEEMLELMQQENALASRYQKLYAGGQVQFDGKSLTLPEMGPYKQSLDRAVRKAAFEADGRFFDDNREELDEIYTKMIENRNAQARKLGYESYVPLSYLRMGRLGYNEADVKSFRDQVAQSVTPLAHEAMKEQFARIGLPDAKFYDTTVSFKDGNPIPQGAAPELLAKAVQMYRELSPETARFIDFMTASQLFDLESRPGKAPGGYCETIPGYGAPFVFSNFNGTSGDVDVLTHEAVTPSRHGWQPVRACVRSWPTPGWKAARSTACPWNSSPAPGITCSSARTPPSMRWPMPRRRSTFLPYGCMVDEFQHIVYSQPHLTPDERNGIWLELERKYRPWNDFDGLPFYGRGAGWQRQLHVYQYPFYYIDYCLAQIVSLQFFAAHLNDPKDAWQRYLALVKKGGGDTYAGLVKAAGFTVPFEQGAISPVAQQVFDWVKEQNKKL